MRRGPLAGNHGTQAVSTRSNHISRFEANGSPKLAKGATNVDLVSRRRVEIDIHLTLFTVPSHFAREVDDLDGEKPFRDNSWCAVTHLP